MKKYISVNTVQTSNHYNCLKSVKIHDLLLIDSLSKRQLDMINNNEKNKFLKSLKHLIFTADGLKELQELFTDTTYLCNNVILSINNIQKELIKHWEKEISNLKSLQNLQLKDFICEEFLSFDKSGIVLPVDINTGSSQQLIINAIYGECPKDKDILDLEFDKYILDKNNKNIDKSLSCKTIYFLNKNGEFNKENIPEKKKNSQIISDTDIHKLQQISDNINAEYNCYKNFNFGIINNKIYIYNLSDVEINLNFKNYIEWDNSFTSIKNKTTPLNFSIQNILYNSYITTLEDIFFTYPSKYQHLLYYNNYIYNKSNVISELLTSSGVYLYSPEKFRKTFYKIYDLPQPQEEDFDNKMYIFEYTRCFIKLYKEYMLLDYNINNIIEQLYKIETQIMEINDFNISNLLSALKGSINILEQITKYSTYNMLISCCSKNIGLPENKLFSLYNNTATELDEKIFTQTYKNSYFTSNDLLSKNEILFNTNKEKQMDLKPSKTSNFKLRCLNREETLFSLKNKCLVTIKNIFQEIGSKYTLLKDLQNANDIHYLLIEEILNYDFKCLTNYTEVIKTRKETFQNNTNTFSKIQLPVDAFSKNIQATQVNNQEKWLNDNIHGEITINKIHEKMSDKILVVSELNINHIFVLPKMIIFEPNFDTTYLKTVLEQLNIPYLELQNATNIFANFDGKNI